MYIIAEYLFIENFIINYTILQITKIITRTTVNRGRIFITAIIAALYPFVMFFPSIIFLTNFYMKIIISILIIKFAYNAKSLALYFKQLSAFYVISFIFAGASIGTYYFTTSYNNALFKSNNPSSGFPIKYIIVGMALGGVLLKNIFHYYQEKVSREKELLKVTIHLNNEQSSFIALIDTGNSLIEPISKAPVFVVEFNAIKTLLPQQLRKIFDNSKENDFFAIENTMEELKEDMLIRLIPFKSIGSSNGILIGFKPDYITILDDNGETTYDDLIVGIFKDELSTDDQYRGLLNFRILDRGNLSVNKN